MPKIIISIVAALSATIFLLSGCSTKDLDAFLADDYYRMVSKKVHDKHYPKGHEVAQNGPLEHDTIPGNKCVFDKIHNKYFCQFPFYGQEKNEEK